MAAERETAAAPPADDAPASSAQALGSATYEIIRQRLETQGEALRAAMTRLDERRAEVFGTIEYELLQADRIVTSHNCVPADMIELGDNRFLFGFNVRFGLKKEMELADVFAIYQRDPESGGFREQPLDELGDSNFLTDFKRLYNIYERTVFRRFALRDGRLFMKFQTGASIDDFAVFKWDFHQGKLRFLDGRAEAEFRRIAYPPPHEFRWQKPDRESYRYGDHPHVSIADRVFVETVGGDLTIKVEDNTKTGEGIYDEPVDDKFQKVDDAEIEYAIVDHLIILRVRPYKETKARHYIYNEKQQTVARVDSIGESCVMLPEGHGLIFPDGYYLSTGELKQFECRVGGMIFERVIHAPNGEDVLYVFYNRRTGDYALMPYRLIRQRIEERITCNGYSLFPNGHLLLFRADTAPQKHHMVQLRQTPFHLPGYEPPGNTDAFLYQVGNRDVVRCLAECNEVMTLVRKPDPYAELYTDLVKHCGAILDSYPWLGSDEGFGVDAALRAVQEAADRAVDEFDRVRRLEREAVARVADARKRCTERIQEIRRGDFRDLNTFVSHLAGLRTLRGELITLREVRYADVETIAALETEVTEETTALSGRCVAFLLEPAALEPYREQAAGFLTAADQVKTGAEARQADQEVAKAGAELEMLIEIVNGLRIEDATQTTRIIDGITTVYSTLNQVRAALRNRIRELASTEGAAQFAARIKLLGQAAASYLDLCDTPAKCEEYLNRISVQIEELEGAFADFEEYTIQLAERRTELYEAFEQRKVALVEQRNRRANALSTAAARILKVIENRLAGFGSIEEINSYMAADMMISRIRETIDQLLELGDAPKADELAGRLKSIQQEATRQLKDRQELFVDGQNVIRLGKHRFNVNSQPLDLTTVLREGTPHLHITSTQYFEAITDPAYLATREVWDQDVVSENREVYRAEFLAWQMLKEDRHPGGLGAQASSLTKEDGLPGRPGDQASSLVNATAQANSPDALLDSVRQFMESRYAESYTRGIHDLDGAKILAVLRETHRALQLARYSPDARACALAWWLRFCPKDTRTLWTARLEAFADRNRIFPGDPVQTQYIAELARLIREFATATATYPATLAAEAGEYLFHQLVAGLPASVSREADELAAAFLNRLSLTGEDNTFTARREALAKHPAADLQLVRDWVRGFLLSGENPAEAAAPAAFRHLEECAAILFCGDSLPRLAVDAPATREVTGMTGSHPRLEGGRYQFDYLDFQQRLRHFENDVVPRFEQYHSIKQQLIERERAVLRLNEFKPVVFSAFVRNELIDSVYLHLVGDNLAKQIGAAGDTRRTDLMGLLLVISPPGYGKTTLLEYIASRLGIAFVKINGPALGNAVTSLDPEEAPNAAAREEIQKLNLALEMGDNVMICVDDIQHCNPEFLQKFISLCDGQRRIESVWRGRTRTCDLRGRKVVVVMAGNPYTESGQQFKIPDMLANRADTYNLGDIIGGSASAFKASYIENAVTSNPTLAPLSNKSQQDIRAFIRMAETGERDGVSFEASYSSREIDEILSVMKKLVAVREVVLRVNQEYIRSAAQADEFRTEPPFRLQGSYRNMNRLAEKVVPIMNDAEVRALILDHYRGESQTLTTGTEANFLKFKELIADLTPAEQARWNEITTTFRRNTTARGTGGEDDPVGRVVGQLSAFQDGLDGIRQALADQLAKPPPPAPPPAAAPQLHVDLAPVTAAISALEGELAKQKKSKPVAPSPEAALAPLADTLTRGIDALRADLTRALTAVHSGTMAESLHSIIHEVEMVHSTLATVKDMAARQRDHLQASRELLETRAKQGAVEVEVTQDLLENQAAFLEHFQSAIAEAQRQRAAARTPTKPAAPENPQ